MKLTQDQIVQVQQSVRRYIDLAGQRYNRTFTIPVVRFDLRGTIGGQAKGSEWVIRVNPVLCAENFEHYVKQTIGHEVAHLIVCALHKGYGRKVQPHGIEWQAVMRNFGLPATRCHSYDVSNSHARRTTKIQYSCNCQIHEVGSKIHRNISILGKRYNCRVCKGVLKLGTQIGESVHKSTPRV